MDANALWSNFLVTGNVKDYLEYKNKVKKIDCVAESKENNLL